MLSSLIERFTSRYAGVVGMNERNRNLIYPNNKRKNYLLADDKLETKKVLERYQISCPKTYGAIGRVGDITKIWNEIENVDSMVIKPASGSGGNGIMLIRKHAGTWQMGGKSITRDAIFSRIANIIFGMYSGGKDDRAILEELIIPDPALTAFYKEGIPDIRIITLKGNPLMGMLRLPTSESDGKANLHQGGIGVGINLQNGELTHAYDGESYITSHPDSILTITGRKIPKWDEIMKLSRQVADAFPLDYLGIDIVLDKFRGPMVLEINVRPGLGIQMANRTGLNTAIKNIH